MNKNKKTIALFLFGSTLTLTLNVFSQGAPAAKPAAANPKTAAVSATTTATSATTTAQAKPPAPPAPQIKTDELGIDLNKRAALEKLHEAWEPVTSGGPQGRVANIKRIAQRLDPSLPVDKLDDPRLKAFIEKAVKDNWMLTFAAEFSTQEIEYLTMLYKNKLMTRVGKAEGLIAFSDATRKIINDSFSKVGVKSNLKYFKAPAQGAPADLNK